MNKHDDFDDKLVDMLLEEKLGGHEPKDLRQKVRDELGASQSAVKQFPFWLKAIAAMLVVTGILSIAYVFHNKDDSTGIREHKAQLAGYWNVIPTGDADYQILNPTTIRLNRGELYISSTDLEVEKCQLTIESEQAVATANGTRFFIGHHHTSNRGEQRMDKKLTRVLVMSGIVSLCAAGETVSAQENEVLMSKGGGKPQKLVVQANNDFGLKLYKHLVAEDGEGNIFFSPYSISNALAMTAEGARGQTAKEMGQVLGFPKVLMRTGSDAQRIPWEISKLHTGFSKINSLFNRKADDPKMAELSKQIAELQVKYDKQKALMEQLQKDKNWSEYRKARNTENALKAKLAILKGKLKTYQLSIANALWGEQTYKFSPEYVKTIQQSYDTKALNMVDFRGNYEAERKKINGWVEEKTNNKIKELIAKGMVDSLTRLVLTNAIYFKGDWVTQFNKRLTRPQVFTMASGEKVKVPLMNAPKMKTAKYAAFISNGSFFNTPKQLRRGQRPKTYPENGFHMLELPYCGEDLSMVVLLPMKHDGLEALEKQVTSENLSKWNNQLVNRDVNVFCPKFKAETKYNSMEKTLEAMGMKLAFNASNADFSGMPASGRKDLYISKVVHKAFVDINEEGTEAAAATAVIMEGRSRPMSSPFVPVFRADHPFIYAIRDNRTGTILFMGRMMNPGDK